MTDAHNHNSDCFVVNLAHYPVIPQTIPPASIFTSHCPTITNQTRIGRTLQFQQKVNNQLLNFVIETCKLFLGTTLDCDFISQGVF